MRFLIAAGTLALAAGMAWGQAPSTGNAEKSNVADEVGQLRQEVAEQRRQMADQQKQMAEQMELVRTQQSQIVRAQQEIEQLRQQVGSRPAGLVAGGSATSRVVDAALAVSAPARAAETQGDAEKPKESPLSFRIGGTEFTPGGWVDFENVFRTTNSGSLVTTNFGNIPFSNTVQGHLTEDRMTAQFSRLNLKVTGKIGNNDIMGYAEMDFNGNDPGNDFVTGNSHTFRERLFWIDFKHNNWEVLGGQTWSWVTPNRRGLGPLPSDLVLTYDEDGNAQVGIPYTRAAEFRLVYHPNAHFATGIALENPEQFTGSGAGEVAFPAAFNAQLQSQFDPNNTSNTTPNVGPDVIPKFAYDTDVAGRHFHFEGVGLFTTVKTTTLAPVAGSTFQSNSKMGASGGAAMNFDLTRRVRFLANAFYGSGDGRYMIGLGPAAVVRPDGSPSLVHSGTGLAGFEFQPWANTLLGAYDGVAYFERNAFLDTSAGAKPNTFIGFGGLNSANSNNRTIQEPTFDWTQTLWRNPQYGAIQLITQTSYLTRSPWFVAAGAPKNAHLVMVFTAMRYVLP